MWILGLLFILALLLFFGLGVFRLLLVVFIFLIFLAIIAKVLELLFKD
ncbi:hypothetical protein AVBRAN12654_03145 [Campylobacter sp. RM12654]|nr:hypothetical protein [Campylobacter sp. RM12654]